MNEPLTGQWADSLLGIERLHVLKLFVWAGLSILVASAIIAMLRVRRADSPLLFHFAAQAGAWGLGELAFAGWAQRGLALRDLSAAVALDRVVWFSVGLDVGIVAVGAALAIVGWRLDRRLGLVGAGLGVLSQGAALLMLDLQLAAGIVR